MRFIRFIKHQVWAHQSLVPIQVWNRAWREVCSRWAAGNNYPRSNICGRSSNWIFYWSRLPPALHQHMDHRESESGGKLTFTCDHEEWWGSRPELKSAPPGNWDWFDDKVRLGYWYQQQWTVSTPSQQSPLLHSEWRMRCLLILLMRLICFSLQGPFSLLLPVSGMQSFKHPCFNLHTTSRVPSGGVSSWTNLDPGSSGTDEAVTKEILGYFRLIREITMRPRCCEARGLLMLLTGLTLRARCWRRVMFEWSELMFVNNQCCWVDLNSTLITCTESIYGLLPGPCGAELSS